MRPCEVPLAGLVQAGQAAMPVARKDRRPLLPAPPTKAQQAQQGKKPARIPRPSGHMIQEASEAPPAVTATPVSNSHRGMHVRGQVRTTSHAERAFRAPRQRYDGRCGRHRARADAGFRVPAVNFNFELRQPVRRRSKTPVGRMPPSWSYLPKLSSCSARIFFALTIFRVPPNRSRVCICLVEANGASVLESTKDFPWRKSP